MEEDERNDFGIVLTATLTPLGLLIGFSFSMAVSRYDQRKNYEEAEANAIGTEYVRAGLLTDADAARVREMLRHYLDECILFYRIRGARLGQINSRPNQLQIDLWSTVQVGSCSNSGSKPERITVPHLPNIGWDTGESRFGAAAQTSKLHSMTVGECNRLNYRALFSNRVIQIKMTAPTNAPAMEPITRRVPPFGAIVSSRDGLHGFERSFVQTAPLGYKSSSGKTQTAMLNTSQNVIITVLTVVASLLFMWGLNRIWPWEKRHAHNDLIGWQLSILGTTYAVILGFMLYTVWTNFGAAELNAENEANALGNLYRLAEGLPKPQQGQIQALARSYAEIVIGQDWPQMAADHAPESSHKVNQDMWRTVMSIGTGSPTEIIAEDHALSELSALTECRRIRLLQNASRLPSVLWCLLIIGGAVTIASASMFGSANTSLHALQVFVFSLLIVLALVAVADIDRPFQGSVHVSDFAFRRAQTGMKD